MHIFNPSSNIYISVGCVEKTAYFQHDQQEFDQGRTSFHRDDRVDPTWPTSVWRRGLAKRPGEEKIKGVHLNIWIGLDLTTRGSRERVSLSAPTF